ncbi:MAG: acyltransferase family protein, partial [Nocardioidaceae bacterium]|nr:acyltransferase family protein [Nocardioidaceae bacterium]
MAEGRARIVAIQGLRAVAVLLVVGFHLGLPVGAGFIGVDIFFVISGFVITRMIFNQTADSRRLRLKAFWAGRIRRLLPALAAM